jgi:hypothetical protein
VPSTMTWKMPSSTASCLPELHAARRGAVADPMVSASRQAVSPLWAEWDECVQ